ncbi:tRNA dihydrouridine(20/20a) synthase DusA [Mesorhizobium sp. BR1-1-16]|uniref:tRNA dihydrouridine(20/20a) synthase DusA n=1 Tax=Mesorhizobium sp. BR1-1-16 TaxID=2876653 RepID=UPI001CCF9C7B|nr:tRNA dihydrouridine(20/20a) synthase DusA [Mesorhizobium sp. BR1-1-16]MBZ9939348.1 tRNA dihydrouridine(20/20a) synthase DusA [Mesorhizobium sp. BR1-1-16]
MIKNQSSRFAVAPMMDWTDRHCRFFHRQLSKHALLYTEMVVADAVIHGDRAKLLGFDEAEHPIALQIGGSDPVKLAAAARIGADFGYDEINLNCGCPSDRVQSGTFGACLMREPQRVADCVAAMKAAVAIPVTVKCRIGVDEQDPEVALDAFADAVVAAGVDGLWVHARKAWLAGLSPKENRDIPPLDYDRVHRLKARFPGLLIGLNGGLKTIPDAAAEMDKVDGVMLGRAAYQEPALLAAVDRVFFGSERADPDPQDVIEAMIPYVEAERARGAPLHRITRHMLGLFHGQPGARRFRQILTVEGARRDAGVSVLRAAVAAVEEASSLAA